LWPPCRCETPDFEEGDQAISRRLFSSIQKPRRVAGVKMPRMHPHMLRHTYVTTTLDAGVPLCDVQIAARHADPRTTMRYDRARKNLDRHPNYILAAFMASGTGDNLTCRCAHGGSRIRLGRDSGRAP
jgi:integrase